MLYDVPAKKGNLLIPNTFDRFTESLQQDFSFDQKYIVLASERQKVFLNFADLN